MEVPTPYGPARIHLDRPGDGPPVGLLVLGHGAGGGVTAPDLLAVTAAGLGLGCAVVRVEQPYRVAGRRAPAPAVQLDTAWTLAVHAAQELLGHNLPLVVGGRSSGARVAARTSATTGAFGYLALAFPLVSPRGVTRMGELDAVIVPALVLQGDRDPFGMPRAAPRRVVHVLAGADHSLRRFTTELTAVTTGWLGPLLT